MMRARAKGTISNFAVRCFERGEVRPATGDVANDEQGSPQNGIPPDNANSGRWCWHANCATKAVLPPLSKRRCGLLWAAAGGCTMLHHATGVSTGGHR